jgi:hypothetical protein
LPDLSSHRTDKSVCATQQVVTYREYVTRRTPPRELAREIVARSLLSGSGDSSPEKIDAIYLSPDAFARRTDEASIADQMGDVFAAAGLPRPVPADDDRVGGWMLMYQMLDADERGPQVPGKGSPGGSGLAHHRKLHRATAHAAEPGPRFGAG